MKSPESTIAQLCVGTILILASPLARAEETVAFNTSWILEKPEVLTYQSHSKQSDGSYQLSTSRTTNGIEQSIEIVAPGFRKSVWGCMTTNMCPRESTGRMVIREQITVKTDCHYTGGRLHIKTVISPNNQVAENTLSCSHFVADFSQIPLLVRTLPLRPGAEFEFTSINPQNNSLVPLAFRVLAEEAIRGTECYKVEESDFEGRTLCWVEKSGCHRVVRFEQTDTGRVTELLP